MGKRCVAWPVICLPGIDVLTVKPLQGKTGAIVVRAVSCTIVAHHPDTVQTTNAATIIEQLVDYINQPR